VPSVYGEVPSTHPAFSKTSAARCQVKEVPRRTRFGFEDKSAPPKIIPLKEEPPKEDIVYTAEDDAAIEEYVRAKLSQYEPFGNFQ